MTQRYGRPKPVSFGYGAVVPLSQLAPPPAGTVYASADHITDKAWIYGTVEDAAHASHAFVLKPA